jgi:hypothetical protein
LFGKCEAGYAGEANIRHYRVPRTLSEHFQCHLCVRRCEDLMAKLAQHLDSNLSQALVVFDEQ